jgi:hypothetical protein
VGIVNYFYRTNNRTQDGETVRENLQISFERIPFTRRRMRHAHPFSRAQCNTCKCPF